MRFLLLLLLCVSAHANAETYYQAYALNLESGWFSSADAASADLVSKVSGSGESYQTCYVDGKQEKKLSPYNWRLKNVYTLTADLWTCGSFQNGFYPGGSDTWAISHRTKSLTCPAGQKVNPATGLCSDQDSCSGVASYCSTLKGSVAMFEKQGQVDMSGGSCLKAPDFQSCSQGCATSAVGMGVQYKNNAGQWMSAQELKVTGGTCNVPPESDQPAQKDTDCAGGYAEMNGVKKCVPAEAAKGDTKEKTTEKADGSKETVKTETKCENGVCETTKTSTKTGADGSTSTETSKTSQDQNSYCSKNPTSTVCAAANGGKNPGSGGSGSGSGGGSGTGTGSGSGNGDGNCTGDNCDGDGNGSGNGSAEIEVPDIEVPKLYERKYPKGVSDAWSNSGIQKAAAKFDVLASVLAPPWRDQKGQCQSFAMNVDLGFVNFGRFDFSPPCSLWLFLWVCMQLGALFLFRALVFGG